MSHLGTTSDYPEKGSSVGDDDAVQRSYHAFLVWRAKKRTLLRQLARENKQTSKRQPATDRQRHKVPVTFRSVITKYQFFGLRGEPYRASLVVTEGRHVRNVSITTLKNRAIPTG